MKKIIAFFVCLLGWPLIASADPAIGFVSQLTDTVLSNISSDKTQEKKLEEFKKEFQSALDLKSVGQFVLGIYWRKASPEQRDAFLEAFMEFTTKSWGERFDMYTGQKIIFTGSRNAERGQIYVDSRIENNPPVEVIWRLRPKDGSFKIIDIIVEGVSMAVSYRNEYTSFLQKNGGNLTALTDELNKKSAAFDAKEK